MAQSTSDMPDHDRIVRLEVQVERYNSDYESEKRTRSEHRAYLEKKLDEIDVRFRRIEYAMYRIMGAFAAIVVAADLVIRLLFGR
jgi:hypothetical protein